jgi:hypothetical protein
MPQLNIQQYKIGMLETKRELEEFLILSPKGGNV